MHTHLMQLTFAVWSENGSFSRESSCLASDGQKQTDFCSVNKTTRWKLKCRKNLRLIPPFQNVNKRFPNSYLREAKVCFFKRSYIVLLRNSQKLPRWNQWIQRGRFCEFLGETIFPSTFFKKQTLGIVEKWNSNF